ncbi:MAG: VrrA/YqfQ family protein [Bacilli bacterium]
MFQNGNISSGFGSHPILGNNTTSKITLSGFLNGTSKTLTTINQVIPIIYQIVPIFKNAKTMFKVANQFNNIATDEEKSDRSIEKNNDETLIPKMNTKIVKLSNSTRNYKGGPIFFQ